MTAQGSRVGPYLLGPVIGAGGMGVVHRASQTEPVQRDVAVKLLRTGAGGDSGEVRFEQEWDTLARMSHPSIARLYGAGRTGDGRPWFAMELIDGRPLDEFLAREVVDLDDGLELVVQVCRAVQHAHQKGVIHRDLTPSNVLVTRVDGRPSAKVIDFGIAKLVDDDRPALTLCGDWLGATEAMSPEQAVHGASEVDARSDVYALGVLLYRVLTGSHPHGIDAGAGVAPHELLRRLRDVVPERPSVRLRMAPGPTAAIAACRITASEVRRRVAPELDWIVMRALARRPDERYGTAEELAADIERHRRGDPIEARAPTAGYVLSRFAARHRVAAGTAVAIVVALAVGLVLAVAEFDRARSARGRAARVATREQRRVDLLRVGQLQGDSLGCWPGAADPVTELVRLDDWLATSGDVLAREAQRASAGIEPPTAADVEVFAAHRSRHRDVARRRAIVAELDRLWAAVAASVAEYPELADFVAQPRPGIVPLGFTPDRPLRHADRVLPRWLFAVGGTGEFPDWVDADGRQVPLGGPGRLQAGPRAAVTLVLLPGGTAWIGAERDPASPNHSALAQADEAPLGEVELRPFLFGRTEVTNFQFACYVAATGAAAAISRADPLFGGDDMPVCGVPFGEAEAFCDWIGLGLPTEAIWEFAYRAGTTAAYWWGDTPAYVSPRRPVPVEFEAAPVSHPFGLAGMPSGVQEWCRDRHRDGFAHLPRDGSPYQSDAPGRNARVLRGGHWRSAARQSRASQRTAHEARWSGDEIGFRVCLR